MAELTRSREPAKMIEMPQEDESLPRWLVVTIVLIIVVMLFGQIINIWPGHEKYLTHYYALKVIVFISSVVATMIFLVLAVFAIATLE